MKKDNEFDSDKYAAEISAAIVAEVFGVVEEQSKAYGSQFEDKLATAIVRDLVYGLVYSSLNNVSIPEKSTAEEAQAIVRTSYSAMKHSIQNAIADGFEAASVKFSGQNLGYYCKVSTAGQPINNLAN